MRGEPATRRPVDRWRHSRCNQPWPDPGGETASKLRRSRRSALSAHQRPRGAGQGDL